MSSHSYHTYHLVDMSPWPLTCSISAMMLTTGLMKSVHQFSADLLYFSFVGVILTMIQWWHDVILEGTDLGLHSGAVMWELCWGMMLFILSEVIFFFFYFLSYIS